MIAKDDHREWQEINDGMGKSYKDESKARFSKSRQDKTPFTQQPFLRDFVYLVVGSKARQVLQGE